MKYYEPTYLTVLVVSLINWLVASVEVSSKIAALMIAIMTIFYLYQKYKGQKLDNDIKRKQLEDE
jgi:hypothetical protein